MFPDCLFVFYDYAETLQQRIFCMYQGGQKRLTHYSVQFLQLKLQYNEETFKNQESLRLTLKHICVSG